MRSLANPVPLRCGAALQNRLAKAAMSENLGAADDHGPTEQLEALYRWWSSSGAGLLITGNLMVDRRHRAEPGNVVIDDDAHLVRLARWAAEAKAGGAAVWAQLNHPGRQAPQTLVPKPVAPSAVRLSRSRLFARPRPLTHAEIVDIVARFAEGARRARRAGFDGVQIHAGHGYLISQFLSPLTNQRTDAWGGALPARARFLLEVVRAVRARVGNDYPIGVKLNASDFQRGGFTPDEAAQVARWIEAEGIDLLEISGGNYERPAMMRGTEEGARPDRAYFLAYAEQIRAATTLPLMVTGGFRSRAGMLDALSSGKVDVIGLARPLVLDAQVARRLLDDEAVDLAEPALRTGVRLFDDIVAVAWYQAQLSRIGSGLAPDPRLGSWRVLLGKLREVLAATGRGPAPGSPGWGSTRRR